MDGLSVIVGERASGKSTYVFETIAADPEDSVVLVESAAQRDLWVKKHRVQAVTVRQVQNGALRGVKKHVYIDDLDLILAGLIPYVDLKMVTMTGARTAFLPSLF